MCECIISILIQERMLCNLDTCSVKNCSVCTCAVQSECIQCDARVCVHVNRGAQKALSMRTFARVWEVRARARGPPDPFPLLNLFYSWYFVYIYKCMVQRSFVVLAGWEGRVGAPAPDDPTRFEDRDICLTALIISFCEPAMIRS
jgi:hypothetical protein